MGMKKPVYVSFSMQGHRTATISFHGLRDEMEGPTMDEICAFRDLVERNALEPVSVTVIAITLLNEPCWGGE